MLSPIGFGVSSAPAVTPDSPEVQDLVDSGLEFLSQQTDGRLGGKCLVALAILKATGDTEHPRIKEAVAACRKEIKGPFESNFTYSNGAAIIFLCELDPTGHRDLIEKYLRVMEASQKEHGGWGYETNETGDTSQTQYGVLAYWEAHAKGFRVSTASAGRVLGWLMRTQDPQGGWGYQGRDPRSEGLSGPVPQSKVTVSLSAAGLGSVLICGHLLGVSAQVEPQATSENGDANDGQAEDLPPAVTLIGTDDTPEVRPTPGARVDRPQFDAVVSKGQAWFRRNFKIEVPEYNNYYLYSLERYKSFEELLSGQSEEEPEWYIRGYSYLRDTQRDDGSWQTNGGQAVDTAFAILFLIRSMRMTLDQSIGDGALVAGRGLPANVATARIENGRLIAEKTKRSVQSLLAILEDPTHPEHDRVLASPRAALGEVSDQVSDDEATRLQQLLRGGEPAIRWVAVRTLARRRNLDDVPHLIHALTDPNRAVVQAARDSLRFVSRRFDGFGLPDDFQDRQRYDAVEKWKSWYLSVRPGARF